ncbi:hypothetical protein MUG84_07985 [Paenibacillus sp. KQZ6P-2]|uniref:Uncharacterized protein n=1 Tax=Paenibacillus mangrovi TaxID=2931978 RepID=A0A9X1WN64_9BACL|nr:hypothetical protein [Paenibacillus mangrovi]MCJ8011691.1 hypothetical protein [Paenibacillus mangrovi]
MIEKQNGAPQKTFRFTRRGSRYADRAGLESNAGFPQLEDQLQLAAAWMREMEQNVQPPNSFNWTGWGPGVRVRHKQHPEYGTGIIRMIISGGLSAYCSFDQFSLSAADWTPSGYYRISQLERVPDVDNNERTPL